jgi:hypothetical protein
MIKIFFLNLLLILSLSNLWAAGQEAVVIADEAVLFADQTRESPIGFLKKGTKLSVGQVPRNKGQVLPTVLNGKVVYISIEDISTASQLDKPGNLEASRFRDLAEKENTSLLSLSYAVQQSIFFKDEAAGVDKDLGFTWNMINLKSVSIEDGRRVGIAAQIAYGQAERASDELKSSRFDIGLGPVLSIVNKKWIKIRLELLFQGSPYFQYEQANDYNESGYAFGSSAQLSWTQFLSKNWGVEFQGGVMAMKVFGLDMPDPFEDYNPAISAGFVSVGLSFKI